MTTPKPCSVAGCTEPRIKSNWRCRAHHNQYMREWMARNAGRDDPSPAAAVKGQDAAADLMPRATGPLPPAIGPQLIASLGVRCAPQPPRTP